MNPDDFDPDDTGTRGPTSNTWRRFGPIEYRNREAPTAPAIDGGVAYGRGGLLVISGTTDDEWVVSASYKGKTVTDAQLELVRAAFGMQDAEERPCKGIARILFLASP